MPRTRVWAVIDKVLERVRNERMRQLGKWGPQVHTPAEWVSIAAEELGEAAERANKSVGSNVEPDANPELQLLGMVRELVQVAAVCVAACEDLYERFPQLSSRSGSSSAKRIRSEEEERRS